MRGRFLRKPWIGWPLTGGLTVLAFLTFLGAHMAWGHVVPSFPDRNERPAQGRGITHWVSDSVIPLTIEGHLDGARTIAIGDSRTWMAVDRATLDASEFGPSAVFWGSGGDLRVLLSEAVKLNPERLIVGLSPHSMGPAVNRLFAEVAREKAPAFDATGATPASVRRWKREETAHLVGAGFPENLVTIFLSRLQDQFLREYDLHHHPTARLEAWLTAEVQRFRFDHVYTLKPSRWGKSWLSINDPAIDAPGYRARLGADHFQNGKDGFRDEILAGLRAVAAKFPTVVVRFPLSPEVRAAEDAAVSPEWLASIAAEVGVPYVDYGARDGTADGSHVTTFAAVDLTKDLIKKLQEFEQAPGPAPEPEDVSQGALSAYRFSQPILELELPQALREISGLVVLEGTRVACIQDELGELFLLDLAAAPGSPLEIVRRKFGPKGDYEAIAWARGRLFVLRSDGEILTLDPEGAPLGDKLQPASDLPFQEFESLAFDPGGSRLLLAPKNAPGKDRGPLKKHERPVYAIDLESMEVAPDPFVVLSANKIIETAEENDWPLPGKTTKKGKFKADLELRISDIALHPITGDLYVLSGVDRTLLVLSKEGELRGTVTFPPTVLPQGEGITFCSNGDLLLTSEGQGGPGRLMKYAYLPQ
ncbi:MAG: hypothetical protein ACJAZN_000430 [Planctomycetota bacterium]|jgi:hypothetical protein